MNIIEIYKKYQIMPSLQLHMLRVGAVASILVRAVLGGAQNRLTTKEAQNIVTACLLHDMGNIIKFDLTYIPEFVQPEGLEYWENVKKEFIERWGNNEHEATGKIILEITKSQDIFELSDQTGFSKAINVLKTKDLSKMICNYSDMRVGPNGILTLKQRTEDGQKRHLRNNSASKYDLNFENTVMALLKIEECVFGGLSIKPEEINDESVNREIEILKSFVVAG